MEIKLTDEEIRKITKRVVASETTENYVTCISVENNSFDKIKEEIDEIISEYPILSYADIEIYSEEGYGGWRSYYASYYVPTKDITKAISIALKEAEQKKYQEWQKYLELHKKYGEINGN